MSDDPRHRKSPLPLVPVLSAALVLVGLLGVPPSHSRDSGGAGPGKELTKTEMETRVRKDLAKRLGIAEDAARVVESDPRTWPDRRLGCAARRGLEEPEPVPGYLFVLEADGKRHTYHTDRAGHIARCEAPKKPLGPILR